MMASNINSRGGRLLDLRKWSERIFHSSGVARSFTYLLSNGASRTPSGIARVQLNKSVQPMSPKL